MRAPLTCTCGAKTAKSDQANSSRIPLAEKNVLTSEQRACNPTAGSNSPAALEQLFEHVFPEDPQHVALLCFAFRRFTPAILLFLPEKKLCVFLREMSPDFATLQLKYNAEADIRAVRAAFHGEERCRCRFFFFLSRSRPET